MSGADQRTVESIIAETVMMNVEQAASCSHRPENVTRFWQDANSRHYMAHAILGALGIDPDMPVEQLRMRLLFGERVERAERQGSAVAIDRWAFLTVGFERATAFLSWLRRPPSASETSGCPAEGRPM